MIKNSKKMITLSMDISKGGSYNDSIGKTRGVVFEFQANEV